MDEPARPGEPLLPTEEAGQLLSEEDLAAAAPSEAEESEVSKKKKKKDKKEKKKKDKKAKKDKKRKRSEAESASVEEGSVEGAEQPPSVKARTDPDAAMEQDLF